MGKLRVSTKALFNGLTGTAFLISITTIVLYLASDRYTKPFAAQIMKFNGAVGFAFASIALLLFVGRSNSHLRFWMAMLFASGVFLIGASNLLEYITGKNLGIDELIVSDAIDSSTLLPPGRLAPNGAFGLILLGTTLLLWKIKPRISQALTLGTAVFGLLSVIGHIYEAHRFYQIGTYFGMTLFASLNFLLLSIAILLSQPENGIIRIATSDRPSGILTRQLLIAALILPLLLGSIGLVLVRHDILSRGGGFAMDTVSSIVLLVGVIWFGAIAMERSERAIAESEEQFRTLANSIPQLAWLSDATGNVTWFNDQWLRYTGGPSERLHDMQWSAALEEDRASLILAKWRHSLDTEQPFEMEFRLRNGLGYYRWFLTRIVPLKDSTNNVARWLCTCTDIDELREGRERIESALRVRDEFLAVASHELKTPLTVLKMNVQVAQRSKYPPEPLRYSRFIDTCLRQTDALIGLVNSLLDVTRIKSGKFSFQFNKTDLSHLVRETVEPFIPQLRAAQIALDMRLSDNLVGYWDKQKLAQVINNLVSNVIRYAPSGQCTITTERVGETAVLRVSDSGPGIDKDHQEHIFERFIQGKEMKRAGLGLGLFIVKEIVKSHAGTISVASELGKGTTFTVALPFQASTPIFIQASGGEA